MKKILITCFFLFLIGCDYSKLKEETNLLNKENATLQTKVKILEERVDSLNNSPENLFSKSFDLFNNEKYAECIRLLNELKGRYPQWEAKEVANRLYKAKNELAIIEKEKKRIAEEKAKFEKELDENITTSYDEFQKTTFYETRRNTTYNRNNNVSFNIEIYMGKNDSGRKYFRLRSKYYDQRSDYHDTQWIFYEKVQLLTDNGANITVNTKYPNKQSDSGSYGLKEWSDDPVSTEDVLKFSNAIIVKVRFTGKYSYDFDMTDDQLKSLKEIIAKYERI